MNNQQPKIINCNYGLASNYGDFIEIHAGLSGQLRKDILAHELRHSPGKYDKSDLKNDFQSKKPTFFKSLWFCLQYPEAFVNFFPLMYSYYKKEWSFNSSAIWPFLYFGIIFSVFFLITLKIGLGLSFLGYTAFVAIMNGILLGLTHIRVKKQKGFQYLEVEA